MKHLSNIYDPKAEHAKMYKTYSFAAMSDHALRDIEWNQHLAWINDNIVGLPKATDAYTVTELIAMNMVGIYSA